VGRRGVRAVSVTDHSEFAAMNAVYGDFFSAPARRGRRFSAGSLPGFKVEIDALAVVDG
jgi:2-iminobutanoate/2-iminopropanoate deaminase